MNDYRSTIDVVGWVLAALSTLCLVARLYTRIEITNFMLGWDDWCMTTGWLFAIISTSLVTAGTARGLGMHIWDISSIQDRTTAAMYVLIAPLFSIISAFFTKVSIVIALMRIMGSTTRRIHKLIAYTPLCILFVLSVLACGVILFFCWPVEKAWKPALKGSCMSTDVLDGFGKSVSAYNAAMDVFVAVIPYFLIRSLNITRKDKRNLFILMSGSIFGAFATIMKIVAMSNLSNVNDITHSWSMITIWYLAENHVLIIAGSFPALRPFWRVMVGKYSSYVTSNKSDAKSRPSQLIRGESMDLQTVGSTPKTKNPPGLYSIAAGDGSEESLNPHQSDSRAESMEVILSYQGDQRVQSTTEVSNRQISGEGPSTDTGIIITKEVRLG